MSNVELHKEKCRANLLKAQEARRGTSVSEETKKKISAKLTGRKLSKATCAKISKSHKGLLKGIPLTESHKQKISLGGKKYWKGES